MCFNNYFKDLPHLYILQGLSSAFTAQLIVVTGVSGVQFGLYSCE